MSNDNNETKKKIKELIEFSLKNSRKTLYVERRPDGHFETIRQKVIQIVSSKGTKRK
jgi:hypothetical protein